MIPRTFFKVRNSLDEMYDIDETTYRRFSSAKEALITVGKEDTGEIGIFEFTHKMFANTFKNIEKNLEGKTRSDYALMLGASAENFIIGTYGDQNSNKQFLKWSPLFVPEPLTKFPAQIDRDKLTYLVKDAATTYGADLVGITELDRRWVYDSDIYKPFIFDGVEHPVENEKEYVIPNSVNKAVVMAISMDKDLILESPKVGGATSSEIGYSGMGRLAVSLAEFMRALGYNAIPCMNDTALSTPLAISAGLGQLSRMGLLLTPEYGPCLRLCKVLTDMPLNIDKPIDFGITEFCAQCLLCARECPADAISLGDRTFSGPTENNNPGTKKWYINAEKCLRFWQENGAPCAVWIAACPFTVGYEALQCALCEVCVAPDCAIQLVTNLRTQNGHKRVEG